MGLHTRNITLCFFGAGLILIGKACWQSSTPLCGQWTGKQPADEVWRSWISSLQWWLHHFWIPERGGLCCTHPRSYSVITCDCQWCLPCREEPRMSWICCIPSVQMFMTRYVTFLVYSIINSAVLLSILHAMYSSIQCIILNSYWW